MRKNVLLMVLFIVITGGTQAQKATATKQTATATQSETPQQKTKELIGKMTVACSLKPEQVTKLTNAYVEYYTKHDVLKKQKNILDYFLRGADVSAFGVAQALTYYAGTIT